MNSHTLVIVFNQFSPRSKTSYIEVVERDDMSCDIVPLKRKPRSPRFDEVMETGEGSYNEWNANMVKKLYGHPLQKPQPE